MASRSSKDIRGKRLIQLLNEDLSGECGAITQYLVYAARATEAG